MSEGDHVTAVHESDHGVAGFLESMVLGGILLVPDHDSFGRVSRGGGVPVGRGRDGLS